MVERHRILSAAIATVAIALSSASCFEDLPGPRQCPPDEQRVMGECKAALMAPAGPGCVTPETHECLQGRGASCDGCAAGDCPDDPSACFADECPARVRVDVPDASCVRLARDAFMAPEPKCLCGCPACAAICDGRGPSVGVRLPPSGGPAMALLALSLENARRDFPASGRLSLYVRARGLSSVAVVVKRGDQDMGLETLGMDNEANFRERVLDFPSVSWSDPSGAPSQIVLFTPGGGTLAEIDCIIPFVRR
jgi:hypothetical protein